MRLKPIGEQVVVVFGASSGIGREAARQFAARGARVVVSARDQDGLDSLVAEIRAAGGEALAVPADAAEFEEVQVVAEVAVRRYGRLDTWAHVAGVAIFASFEETTLEEFRQVLEVNLLGPVHAARAALPYLRRSGGALIIVSSIEAVRALPNQTAYASSKYGVHGFIKSLRMEIRHARWPVSLTEVMPATINTPLFDQAGTRLGVKPIGVPPVYPPQQVARAILRAAVHPQEEIIVGGAGKLMAAGERLAPRLTEALLQRIAFQAERTDEPKPADAPHNLFEPLPGHDRVEGTVGGSTAVRAALRPLRAAETNWWLVAGGVLGAVALLAVRRRDGA